MWFKNLQVFRFTEDIESDRNVWNEKLTAHPFSDLKTQQVSTLGFSPPIKSMPDNYFHSTNGYGIFCIKQQEKIIPASVINEKIEEKVEAIRDKEQRKVTRKERTDLKEDIIQELTPRAFSKTQYQYAYISFKDNLLIINSSSAKKADLVIDCLRDAFGRAPLIPITPKMIPTQSMTQWLNTSTLPQGFMFGDSLVLKDLSDQGSTIRCKQQDLLADEIHAHLQSGLVVTELALLWKDRIQFTLNEKFIIKSIKFTDVVTDTLDQSYSDDPATEFDQNFALMTLEFSVFITDLMSALGGENKAAQKEKLEAALADA